MSASREEILSEIRRTALENGGNPLGRARFEQITGISEYDVGRFWARHSDAVRAAGFEPNTLNVAHSEAFLMEKYIGLVRKLGHVPTRAEMRLERSAYDPTFPNAKVYDRFGTKRDLLGKALEYSTTRPDPETVRIVTAAVDQITPIDSPDPPVSTGYGFVYIVRGHPGEYKIGRTNLVDRRVSELGVTSAVAHSLVHEIKTDDPVGIEAYWHNRFRDKRMRGEWFKLSAADVKALSAGEECSKRSRGQPVTAATGHGG